VKNTAWYKSGDTGNMVSTNVIFYISFFAYILLHAGSFYNVQQSPPSMGNENGKPVAILVHQVHRQYIIEGMAAAFMVLMGGVGSILFTSFGKPLKGSSSSSSGGGISISSKHWKRPDFQQYALLGFGVVLFVIGYNILTIFMKIKVPRYLST
jgi:hypothetical protein